MSRSSAPKVAFGRAFGQSPAIKQKLEFPWETDKKVALKNRNLRPGDADKLVFVPYRDQGNPEFETPEVLSQRSEISRHPGIKAEIREIWKLIKKSKNNPNQITRESYIEFYIRVCHLLNPDLAFKEALNLVEQDWKSDIQKQFKQKLNNNQNEKLEIKENNNSMKDNNINDENSNESPEPAPLTSPVTADSASSSPPPVSDSSNLIPADFDYLSAEMSEEQFSSSLFELADQWTTGIIAEEYIEFLQKIFRRVTVTVKN